jgi:hypothetical protein
MELIKVKKILDSEIVNGYFNRVDVIVRYMYIEFFLGETHKVNPYELYKKMCMKRMGHTHARNEDEVTSFVMKFNSLIESVYQNGFFKNSAIELSNSTTNKLVDGSHRIAVALYMGLEDIPFTYRNSDWNVEYGFDWFMKNDFTELELEEIENCYNRVMGRLYK